MQTYAQDVIRLRKEAGLTGSGLADLMDCSPQYIWRVEHDQSLPSDEWAMRALRQTGVDPQSDVGLQHLRLLVEQRGHVTLPPSSEAVQLLARTA